jgi:hypothetical protein
VSEQSSQAPVPATLDERVRLLESRVAVLTEAIQVLARGLEDIPTAEPGQRPAARAARRAYDLLLETEFGTPASS